LVLGLELEYTSGCDVLVAALESVPETSARHCHDFVTDLHKAKGIGDDLLLGAVVRRPTRVAVVGRRARQPRGAND